MLKHTLLVTGLCLSCLASVQPASAEEPATIVLRSGDRISGELLDLGGAGFTIRVNGQERLIEANEVAAVEFTPGAPSADTRARLRQGRPIVVLRNGQLVEGSLFDIGGSRPLRLSLNTLSGQRDFTSSEVAQIYYADPVGEAAGSAVQEEVRVGDIRVEANRPWTDSGISVRRGERVIFNSTGNINVAEGASAGVNGTSAVNSPDYPVRNAAAGTLIGRVGNSPPFAIGSQAELTMPAAGRLMLGVNDDHYADNNGFFSVSVSGQQPAIRRR
jgi:hypothetical protein